jgi:hypothetical protein
LFHGDVPRNAIPPLRHPLRMRQPVETIFAEDVEGLTMTTAAILN